MTSQAGSMTERGNISILGSGWLGFALAERLQSTAQSVHLSTRSPQKALQLKTANITPYIVDITALSKNIQLFLQAKILIINITCKQTGAYQALVSEIEKSSIQHVLFISSTSVYPAHQGLCKESDIIQEENNLRCIEKLFTENTHFSSSVIRFAGLVGPKRHPGRFFANGKSIRDALAKVNLIHQQDCLGLIQAVLEQNAWGEIFNGCADNHPTKHAYYTFMAKSLGYPIPDCLFNDDSATKVVCNQKVKSLLGYQFTYPDVYHIIC